MSGAALGSTMGGPAHVSLPLRDISCNVGVVADDDAGRQQQIVGSSTPLTVARAAVVGDRACGDDEMPAGGANTVAAVGEELAGIDDQPTDAIAGDLQPVRGIVLGDEAADLAVDLAEAPNLDSRGVADAVEAMHVHEDSVGVVGRDLQPNGVLAGGAARRTADQREVGRVASCPVGGLEAESGAVAFRGAALEMNVLAANVESSVRVPRGIAIRQGDVLTILDVETVPGAVRPVIVELASGEVNVRLRKLNGGTGVGLEPSAVGAGILEYAVGEADAVAGTLCPCRCRRR